MTARNFSNTAVEAELSTSVASGTTGFQVSAVTGFPSVPFTCVIAEGQADEEVILVTGLSGTTLTVTRGYNGTTAVAHSQGASLTHGAVALDFQEANDHVNETTTAHGLTLANVLTTSNSKTVTGKTFDGDDNTFTDIPASAVKNLPINAITSAGYTLVLADARKHVTVSHASDQTLTIPLQASVAWLADARIPITNLGAGVWTIAISGGSGLNGDDLTIAEGESVVLLRTASNVWWCLPFSTGSAVPRGTISGTTGSPTTSANGGATCYKWTADGTFTVDVAGLFTARVCGGGGGGAKGAGGGAGGGGGGGVVETDVYLTPGTYQVKIGAGGTYGGLVAARDPYRGYNGGTSMCGPIGAAGGGGGGDSAATPDAGGQAGGSGGGAGSGGAGANTGGAGITGQGYAGGNSVAGSSPYPVGGGGGAGGAGANGSGSASGAGGAGVASSISGASVTLGGGGGGSTTAWGATAGAGGSGGGGAGSETSGTAGTANTGGGGGGGRTSTGGAGGSGVVYLLVGTV